MSHHRPVKTHHRPLEGGPVSERRETTFSAGVAVARSLPPPGGSKHRRWLVANCRASTREVARVLPFEPPPRYPAAVDDPELASPIEAPWPYRLRKLRRTWQLFGWMTAALAMLWVFWGSEAPPMGAICGLIGVAPILVLPALKPFFANIREIRAARAAKPLNRQALAHIQKGEGVPAEAALRTALATPNLGPPARAGLVHNLGIAVFVQGEYAHGSALIAHARASGWMDTWQYRNAMAVPAKPD